MLSVLFFIGQNVLSQSSTEKISKTYSFEKKNDQNAILVFNINGDVTVEGIQGDRVIVEVTKTITAKTNDRLHLGKEEIQLGVKDLADSLIFYVVNPEQEFGNWSNKWSDDKSYGYHSSRHFSKTSLYDYKMDFIIKVPQGTHIHASTINDGEVEVKNTSKEVEANNINGSISLQNISGTTHAKTINGNVDIVYANNPTTDCNYYSLNGHINLLFKSSVNALITFKSFNGSLYTNVDQLSSMPSLVSKTENQKGTKYKIENERFKLGSGGPTLNVETFNGNAYLKENK